MKLTRLELENFRCFGRADFDFVYNDKPLDVALIVGDNGAGKSSILQAIAGFFAYTPPDEALPGYYSIPMKYGAEPLSVRDIRWGVERAKLSLRWRDFVGYAGPQEYQEVAQQAYIHKQPTTIGGHTYPEGFVSLIPTPETDHFFEWIQTANLSTPIPTGLIVLFDVYRQLPPQRAWGPNIKQVVQHRCEQALAPTVRQGHSVESRFGQLSQWIVNLAFLRLQAKVDRGEDLPLWDTLRRGLDTLLAPYTFWGVDENFEVLFDTPTGRVPLEALSDGARSILVIVLPPLDHDSFIAVEYKRQGAMSCRRRSVVS